MCAGCYRNMKNILIRVVVLLCIILTYIVANDNEDIAYEHSRDYRLVEDHKSWEHLIHDWKIEAGKHLSSSEGMKKSVFDVAKSPSIEEVQKFVLTFEPAFQTAQKTLKNIVKSSAVLTGRVKAAYSIQGKLEKDGTRLEDLFDIIGLRLTCQSVKDSLEIANAIEKAKDSFEILKKKCYGMCPNAGKYKDGGYRRIHLILRLKPENKTAELQIGTPFTNYWADWSHDFIYKGPTEITSQNKVKKYSISLADYFLKLDNDRDKMPKCPKILKNSNALDILQKALPEKDALKMFNKVNQPPNACYWWYDMLLALPENACCKQNMSLGTNKHSHEDVRQSNQFRQQFRRNIDILDDHTRDYILLDDNLNPWGDLINNWKREAQNVISVKRTSSSLTTIPTIDEIEKYIKTYEKAFQSAQNDIKNIVKSSAVLTGRLKAAYSIQGKLEKDKSQLKDLNDIIGLRLTCQTVKDAIRISNAIKKAKKTFGILEEKCYGMCPGHGKYKKGGYRRIHLILRLIAEDKTAELQIGTPYTNYWSDWNHDFIYKGPPEISNSGEVNSYSIALAEYFLTSDSSRTNLPLCPTYLRNANALDILKSSLPSQDAYKMFKKIGEPPSGCFWWYDMKLGQLL